jgi:hypothetical protein
MSNTRTSRRDIEKGSPEVEERRNSASNSNESKYGDANEEYSSLLSYINRQREADEVREETEEAKIRKRIW